MNGRASRQRVELDLTDHDDITGDGLSPCFVAELYRAEAEGSSNVRLGGINSGRMRAIWFTVLIQHEIGRDRAIAGAKQRMQGRMGGDIMSHTRDVRITAL